MFLGDPPSSPAAQRAYEDDRSTMGYVMEGSRLWAHLPEAHDGLFELLGTLAAVAGLSDRQRGVLITACASTIGDSYCSMAWGWKLARLAGDDLAGAVLRGVDDDLDPREQVLARWARRLARDANSAGPADVQELRDAGYDDRQVLAITAYVALRMAFSTVNDGLGVRPERELRELAPPPVRAAVRYGRSAEG